MTTIQVEVDSLAKAFAKVGLASGALMRSWRSFWDRLDAPGFSDEGELVQLVKSRWDRTFDLSIPLSGFTVQARRDALSGGSDVADYYTENDPNERATAAGPAFEWTGALREAASRFTSKGPLDAVIDPDANYAGPIPGGWNETGLKYVPEDAIFPRDELEETIERQIEPWAADRIREELGL